MKWDYTSYMGAHAAIGIVQVHVKARKEKEEPLNSLRFIGKYKGLLQMLGD